MVIYKWTGAGNPGKDVLLTATVALILSVILSFVCDFDFRDVYFVLTLFSAIWREVEKRTKDKTANNR